MLNNSYPSHDIIYKELIFESPENSLKSKLLFRPWGLKFMILEHYKLYIHNIYILIYNNF